MASAAAAAYSPLKPSWERIVKLPQSSQQWIKEYGLKANKLTWPQIAAKLGFKKQSGAVKSVGSTVDSRYGDGLFTQYSTAEGQLYQLTAPLQKIEEVEHQLLSVVTKLKSRLRWLQSGSRLMFGVLLEKRPVLVVDSAPSYSDATAAVAAGAVEEQCVHTQCFNVIQCCNDMEEWQSKMAAPSPETIESALEWLRKRPSAGPEGSTKRPAHSHTLQSAVLEALNRAMSYSEADSIHLVTHDNGCMGIHAELVAMAKQLPIPLHVVIVNCQSSDTLCRLKELTGVAHGRCHTYRSRPGPGPSLTREDVVLLTEELDQAKTALAEVQALRLEMNERTRRDRDEGQWSPKEVKCEEFMTSAEWLNAHGVRRKRLLFSDLVASLAFRHCDGVLRNPSHQPTSEVDVVPSYEIIQAKYCSKFVHLRWKDGGVVHINLTTRMAESFQERLEHVTARCRERMSWLRRGSRELFGTILEDCVALVVDTSSSMELHLPLVKHKFVQLVQEQLCHKRQFTVLQYSTSVNPWRPRLVPVSTHTMGHAKQWVESLQVGGTSNLLDVLQLATTLPHVQGVYLLTDGRPDQSPSTILAARQSWPAVPIHTISFNCADTQANHFLAQLAADSGGRYHYFADGPEDRQGPVPYKSVDMQQLLDEVSLASHQLVQVQQLAAECKTLRDTPEGRGKGRDTGGLPGQTEGGNAPSRLVTDGGIPSEQTVEGEALSPGEEVLSRSRTPSVSSVASENGDRLAPRRKAKSLLTSKRWLQSNSLTAKGLTLVDALGPSSILLTPSKPLPHSGTRVYGKVMKKVMPVRHMSSEGRVTLVHPTHPDLRAFKDGLNTQCAVYRARLNSLTRAALPVDVREELCRSLGSGEGSGEGGGEGGVEYMDHKEAVLEAVARTGWRRRKEDFQLLEEELLQGEKTLGFLDSVLSASLNRDDDSDIISLASGSDTHSTVSSALSQPSSLRSHASSTATLHSSQCSQASTLPPPARGSGLRQGEAVLAQDINDGFFYKGKVASVCRGRKVVVVEFADSEQQEVKRTRVIQVGGARPAPVLKEGCNVLVRVQSRHSAHWESHDSPCDIHIPGSVLKVPTLPQLSSAFYSVLAYNRKSVMCTRRHVHPISSKQFEVFTSDICELQPPPVEPEGGASSRDTLTLPHPQHREEEKLRSDPRENVELNVQAGGEGPSGSETGDRPGSPPEEGVEWTQGLEEGQAAVQRCAVVDEGTQATEVCERGCSPIPLVADAAVNTVQVESEACPGGPPLHPPVEDRGTCTEWLLADLPSPATANLATEEGGRVGERQRSDITVGLEGTDHGIAFCPPQSSTPIPSQQQNSESVPAPPVMPSIVTERVLARWSMDGWYRKGLVVKDNKDGRYIVMDDARDSDVVATDDLLLLSKEPLQNTLALGSFVLARHPKYQGVYGPAQVTAHIFEDHYAVLMFDGQTGRCSRHEMFLVTKDKYTRDVQGIVAKQQEWVGQVVVSRRDEDGLFYHGTIQRQSNGHFTIMSLQDGTVEDQISDHVFGLAQKRRPIQCGDYVVAFEDGSTTAVGVPGQVIKCVGGKLDVELCHEERWTEVDAQWCYWVSEQYYHDCIECIMQRAQEDEGSSTAETDTE